MAGKTTIAWTDRSWNPTVGCDKVSPGCKGCYAEKMGKRLRAMALADVAAGRDPGRKAAYIEAVDDRGRWTGKVPTLPDALGDPLKWRAPSRIFVNSMSDLFHDGVPFEFIAAVFGVMAACQHHTFQVLTKRPARGLEFFAWAHQSFMGRGIGGTRICPRNWTDVGGRAPGVWPIPNVHLGVSVENQEMADARIPLLLQCPAAVRFVSYEPALGPVDFIGWGPDAPTGPAADTPERWADFVWPEWVPPNQRAQIESFWLEAWGRGPRAWLRDHVHQHVPATGTRRSWSVDGDNWARISKHDAGTVDGRYLHCWNNVGRVVTDDGRVLMAASGPGTGWAHRREDGQRIDWIIVGGESGPNARPFDVAWARSTIEQCRAAGVACFVKQLGARPEFNGAMGFVSEQWKLKDKAGADPAEWPEDLRVQEFPEPGR